MMMKTISRRKVLNLISPSTELDIAYEEEASHNKATDYEVDYKAGDYEAGDYEADDYFVDEDSEIDVGEEEGEPEWIEWAADALICLGTLDTTYPVCGQLLDAEHEVGSVVFDPSLEGALGWDRQAGAGTAG